MNETESQMAQACVAALQSIAASMETLAAAAANSAQTVTVASVAGAAKRPRGRPRKDAAAPVTPGPVSPATLTVVPEPAAPPVPTEEERKEAFGKLRKALQDCLALHGEEVARTRLQFPKFSEVPFEAINDTIGRLAA